MQRGEKYFFMQFLVSYTNTVLAGAPDVGVGYTTDAIAPSDVPVV